MRSHLTAVAGMGAPPRVRGLLYLNKLLRAARRSTPARAGIITLSGSRRFKLQEHPRACGDYHYVTSRTSRFMGAPPRVRGLYRPPRIEDPPAGSTPARAGIMTASSSASSLKREHPRACGDYDDVVGVYGRVQGAPPRVRGLSWFQKNLASSSGSTPARAGIIRSPDTRPCRR